MLVVNEWGEQGEEGEFCQRKDTFIKNWARCVAKFPKDTISSLRLVKNGHSFMEHCFTLVR